MKVFHASTKSAKRYDFFSKNHSDIDSNEKKSIGLILECARAIIKRSEIFFAICIIIAILNSNIRIGVPKITKIKKDDKNKDEEEWILVRRRK